MAPRTARSRSSRTRSPLGPGWRYKRLACSLPISRQDHGVEVEESPLVLVRLYERDDVEKVRQVGHGVGGDARQMGDVELVVVALQSRVAHRAHVEPYAQVVPVDLGGKLVVAQLLIAVGYVLPALFPVVV